MGALTSLDLANNNIGQLAPPTPLPDGWEAHSDGNHYRHKDGSWGGLVTVPGAKPFGAIAIASAIPDMGALSLANVMGNRIGKDILSKLQEIMRSKPNLISLCGIADDATEVDLSGLGMDADDAIILASELPDKGALLSLNISNSFLVRGLFQGNTYGWDVSKGHTKPEDNSANYAADATGIIALANVIPDMRAISSVNLLKNRIPVEQAQELVKIMQSKEKLVTLCGLSKEETELDFSPRSGQCLRAGDAVLIANDISDMGALTSLNLAGNLIGGYWDVSRQEMVATPEGTLCGQ
jgi:hypothetical protein